MPQLLNGGHPRHGKRAQRHTIDIIFVLQDFGAQTGHVDIGRALTAAAFAGKAAIQNFGEFLGLQDTIKFRAAIFDRESFTLPPSCEDFAKHVGASASGLGLVAAHFVGRTERATNQIRLTTVASAVALLDAAHQRMKLRAGTRGTFYFAFDKSSLPIIICTAGP